MSGIMAARTAKSESWAVPVLAAAVVHAHVLCDAATAREDRLRRSAGAERRERVVLEGSAWTGVARKARASRARPGMPPSTRRRAGRDISGSSSAQDEAVQGDPGESTWWSEQVVGIQGREAAGGVEGARSEFQHLN